MSIDARPARAAGGPPGTGEVARFIPLYRQIKALIVRGLQSAEWKPGEAIPSENELALRFGVSQGTVRKAIDELAAGNLLVRRQGRGTFVATHHSERTQFRFLRLRPDAASGQPSLVSRVLECRRQRAPGDVAKALRLRTGETVVLIRRLLSFDAKPEVLDEIWLPGARFRGLSAERLARNAGPLYGLFETEFGVRMIRAAERLKAVPARAPIARVLGVAAGTPVLLVERTSFTYDDVPVELRRGYCLTREFHYFNELS